MDASPQVPYNIKYMYKNIHFFSSIYIKKKIFFFYMQYIEYCTVKYKIQTKIHIIKMHYFKYK